MLLVKDADRDRIASSPVQERVPHKPGLSCNPIGELGLDEPGELLHRRALQRVGPDARVHFAARKPIWISSVRDLPVAVIGWGEPGDEQARHPSFVIAQVTVLLELADHLALVGVERSQPGAQRPQLGVRGALLALDGRQKTTVVLP